ncbi:uncharacterized protein LOC127844552 [Dreissena polymorpha]|uniref:Schlafen AlbA-2 domain-containing protein n=1 Tax=Dreissena polymorpha TaxID=45954 RepID=A0A9D4EDU9_DREPO|nr:uncharacterized protein LOC127844552 [Dreissena polymorpha]XP_052230865.1 uncharacterized protein LOC127844552 [Dreissena polymorpha]XP_052230866.1 uncharacterized protein LOC127844552 [Dreissena polymorpha]XP_052230867.1 uncharacterized protein LOC127844552 [Dreissena polymorpha]KAH3778764.1 hypothetical protein DPMN_180235 [Dreissena polymorpha]
MSKRYYIRNQLMPCEEDFTHEFKGHRNICVENLPPWTQANEKQDRASRRAVSRTLNAFLNTGKGGTAYLGVIDNGQVKGLTLSVYQKAHVLGSVYDLMARYRPPVKSHRYQVRFIPVFDSHSEAQAILENMVPEVLETDLQDRAHSFRTHDYCWCDKDNAIKYNAGILQPDYVIEISVLPWLTSDPRNVGDGCGSFTNLHPIHEDEEGNCFFRRQASLVQYTMTELAQLTRHEVKEQCLQTIKQLKEEIAELEARKANKIPD